MYLKKLEISGFKSFASKTTLDFLLDQKKTGDFGVTAIVGPNGSGKSNIADALRWVMGEQSMKNLRGKKSEDIIFAGSGKKARLGSAHVTLFFDNSDKRIPLEFEEVSISRKIFRSGESEYIINGSRVRLQDVTDILAKAGVGRESYAIINQGMADSVLNATPLERRTIIEDAAGVKQFQVKKERSLRKLESTRQNLKRVRELTEEIRPHLRMLKRQAEKAGESEAVGRSLQEKQTKLFSHLWHNFKKEQQIFNEAKEEIGRRMLNAQREVDKLTDAIGSQAKEELDDRHRRELENQERIWRSKINNLERELIVSEGRVEIEKEKQKNVQILEEIKVAPASVIPIDFRYVRSALEEIRREQEKLVERLEKVEQLSELQEIKEYARVIQQRLYDLRSEIEKGKKEEQKVEEKKAETLEKAPEKPMADSKELVAMRDKIVVLRAEIKKAEEELSKVSEEWKKETEANREKRQKFFLIEAELRKKQSELEKLKDQYSESKIALARVEVREEDLKKMIQETLRKEAENLPVFPEEFNRQVLEGEIARLKIKMEQIGGIDPMVIEEYNETNKRFEFLTTESADLENAISSLNEVIREMDQKIEKEFATTFEEINREFTKYFRIIFGGGNAHLTKLRIESRKLKTNADENGDEKADAEDGEMESQTADEEKNTQTGIDITACPPGKKIANLSILSGGERSLTSLALLFAIISHNPPPFAILDEVEAALDEANSKRFGKIIQELSDTTQFVTITHNRETMRQASLLYGVTMGEDGISKLLSVRLDQIGAGGKILNKT